MKTKARLLDVFKNLKTQRYQVTLEVEATDIEFFNPLFDIDLSVEMKKYSKKRSLSANALFHAMCDQIGKAITPPLSAVRVKNQMIGMYGFHEYVMNSKGEIEPMTIKTNLEPDKMLEQEYMHCRPAPGGDENTWFYWVYRPTRTYNTEEFSKLLDGTLETARELGIDTITDREKQEVIERWGKEYEQRYAKN